MNAWWRRFVETRSRKTAFLLVLGTCLYIPIRVDRAWCGENITCGPWSGYRWVWESGAGAFDASRWFVELIGVLILVVLANRVACRVTGRPLLAAAPFAYVKKARWSVPR
jgi:hypothetical protein